MTDQFPTKKLLAQLLFIFLISGGFSTYSFSQSAGTLDNTFGVGGKVITPNGTGNSVAIQSDGKILLGGSNLVRYNSDGTLDNTFGIGGKVITAYGAGNSIAIQSDGKILLGGSILARYNSDGTLDNTFGIGGMVFPGDAPGYYNNVRNSVVIQSDGKILLGGYGQHNTNDNSYFIILRYNTDGTLDNTFDTNGVVTGGLGQGYSMSILNDGKILLGGSYYEPWSNTGFTIERYNTNGTLDTTFGIGGKVTTLISPYGKSYSMDIQSDGKIVLGGYSRSSGSSENDFTLARYNSNGSLDNTFGIGGIITTPVGDGTYGSDNSVVIQSDGKIILAGTSKDGSNQNHFTLVRYNSDGTLDTNFGIGGKTVTPIGISFKSIGKSLGIDSNGKILLGGYGYALNDSTISMVLVRYHSNVSVGIGSFKEIDNKIYPNPFNSSTTIQFSTPVYKAELKIYNTYGQLIKQIENISGQEIQLSRNNLPSGVYFFKLMENNKIIVADKLIISDE
ncbi:MAG: T9SS type A sorting domain-containing protein [Crocinitomicaceae bacterium]|nr:T9SS type A sorting domain-containing protein [Crocinitomicaceae bacterium]